MEVEISTKIIVDSVPKEFGIKISDGDDIKLKEVVQAALTKLTSEMKSYIEKNCSS